MERKNKNFFRIISLFLLQTFIFYNISFAVTDKIPSNPQNDEASSKVVLINDIGISKDVGTIRNKYTGKEGRLIIHIQDAHCNYEAQTNISKILKNLSKNHNVNLVSVEGADGFIDTAWFKAFPDAEIRKEVADYFMKKGEITGAEFLSITEDYPIKLFGAENRDLYIKNLNIFTTTYPYKEEIEKYLLGIKTVLGRLKGYVYNKPLRQFDSKVEGYKDKDITLSEYARILNGKLKKHNLNLKDYRDFSKLLYTLVYEDKIDFDVVDRERAALIDKLSSKLPKENLQQLVVKSFSFKTGKLSAAEYYDYLKKISSENGIQLSKTHPNLSDYVIYTKLYDKIDNEKLFEELDDIKNAVKARLFRNEDQRTLSLCRDNVNILLGLINIKLSNKEFDYYKRHKDEFKTQVFTKFIKSKVRKYNLSYNIEEPSDIIKEHLPELEKFYEIAMKRDRALVNNTIKAMNKEKTDTAVLITGGFHTEGITRILEEQDISYIVVCPTITKDVESPYIKVLTNQRTPFEEILIESTTPATEEEFLGPYLLSKLVPLTEKQLKDLQNRIEAARSARGPKRSPGHIVSRVSWRYSDLIGRVRRVKREWAKRTAGEWIGAAREKAKEQGIEFDGEIAQNVFLLAFYEGAKKQGLHSAIQEDMDWLVRQEFAKLLPAEPVREKTVGATLGDKAIDEAMRKCYEAGRVLTIFEDGKVPENIKNNPEYAKYAELPTLLMETIQNLKPEVFQKILSGPIINASPGDEVTQSFTKENLLRALRGELKPGSGFKIELVNPLEQVKGVRVPGILMTKEGSNYGHYSTKNNAIYIPLGLVDILQEENTAQAKKKLIADFAHELAEYTVLKLLYPEDEIVVEHPQSEIERGRIAHYISQLLEIEIAGYSTKGETGILGPRSALDDTLDDITESYFFPTDKYAEIYGEENAKRGYQLSIDRLGGEENVLGIINEIEPALRPVVAFAMVFGKGDIFRFWHKMTPGQKTHLLNKLRLIPIEETERYFKKFIIDGQEGAYVDLEKYKLEAPKAEDSRIKNKKYINARRIGEKAFKKGQIAFLELAGGKGTRLRLHDQKSKMLLNVSQVQNKSLARMHAERIRALAEKYGKPVPWIIMTSDDTDREIRDFFEQYKETIKGKKYYFKQIPVEWVKFITQVSMPQITNDGEYLLNNTNPENPSKGMYGIVTGGFGHGDARDLVLRDEGIQEWLRNFGVEYICMRNTDNAFMPDEAAFGWHILSGQNVRPGEEHMSVVAIEKTSPAEKVGMAVILDGNSGMLEYSLVPADKIYLMYTYEIKPERFIIYKDDNGAIRLRPVGDGSSDDIALFFKQNFKKKEIDGIIYGGLDINGSFLHNDAFKEWIEEHFCEIKDLPYEKDGTDFELPKFRGIDYTRRMLERYAHLWLRVGNINQLIWSLKSFRNKKYPLSSLPVVIAKNKAVEGYMAGSADTARHYTTKASTHTAHKFERMAFHGFFGNSVNGAHIIVKRVGGFAPIKNYREKGIDTIETARKLFSEYDKSLLRDRKKWAISDSAVVEISSAARNSVDDNIAWNGVVGESTQLYLGGKDTSIREGFHLRKGILRLIVYNEYLAHTKIRIGKNVTIAADFTITLRDNGEVIVDDGALIDKTIDLVLDDGQKLHVKSDGTFDLTLPRGFQDGKHRWSDGKVGEQFERIDKPEIYFRQRPDGKWVTPSGGMLPVIEPPIRETLERDIPDIVPTDGVSTTSLILTEDGTTFERVEIATKHIVDTWLVGKHAMITVERGKVQIKKEDGKILDTVEEGKSISFETLPNIKFESVKGPAIIKVTYAQTPEERAAFTTIEKIRALMESGAIKKGLKVDLITDMRNYNNEGEGSIKYETAIWKALGIDLKIIAINGSLGLNHARNLKIIEQNRRTGEGVIPVLVASDRNLKKVDLSNKQVRDLIKSSRKIPVPEKVLSDLKQQGKGWFFTREIEGTAVILAALNKKNITKRDSIAEDLQSLINQFRYGRKPITIDNLFLMMPLEDTFNKGQLENLDVIRGQLNRLNEKMLITLPTKPYNAKEDFTRRRQVLWSL